MISARHLSRWCGPALVLLVLAAGSAGAPAQGDAGLLRVTLAVCPMGAEAGPEVCADRLARAFDVSVVDAAGAPVAQDVAASANGEVVIPLIPDQSGRLRVVAQTAVNVGARSVSCQADGNPVSAELTGAGAAIPIFQVDAPPGVAVDCVVSLFGSPGDDELLDIVSGRDAATPAAGTPSRATPIAGTPPAATPMAITSIRSMVERS